MSLKFVLDEIQKTKYSAKNSFNKIGVDEKVHCFLESMNHGTQYVVRDLMYY
jgi:hypothetical protein